MRPFTKVAAVAVAIEAVNVDTDQVIPARFLKYPREKGYGQYLFHDLRFDDSGGERADFILNQAPYREAGIVVANENFGCGSSREGAIYALADYGIRAVIAPSFGDIFHNNALKNGLLPVHLDGETCKALRARIGAEPGCEMSVDLEGRVVTGPDGAAYPFVIDDFWREALLKGLDEIALTLERLDEIEAFEARRLAERPWLARR